MAEALIYDALRTPRGKGKKDGSLHEVKPITLLSGVLRELQARHDFDTAQVDDVVIVAVQDSGSGIAARDLPRIFERFYKADRARSGGGTGLGLAIAKHSVNAHNGRLWVESTEGVGSTFSFTLPLVNLSLTHN